MINDLNKSMWMFLTNEMSIKDWIVVVFVIAGMAGWAALMYAVMVTR